MRWKVYFLVLDGVVNFLDISGVEWRIACYKLVEKGSEAIVID